MSDVDNAVFGRRVLRASLQGAAVLTGILLVATEFAAKQGDLHPDPRAAHAIAMAIAAKLCSDLASQHAGITRQVASAGG